MDRDPHAQLLRRLRAARGLDASDLLVRNVSYLDVFSGNWIKGDLAVKDGVIVGLTTESETSYQAAEEISGQGCWLVPGFIDAHVHVESSMMMPASFEDAVLKCGTTTAICDPHELANVMGLKGIEYFLQSAESLVMDLWVQMSSCVPATDLETNGGGTLLAADLQRIAHHPRSLGLAEMMNVPGILNGDPLCLDKIQAFAERGRPLDGHCPLLSGKDLSAYAAVGINSCHESSQLPEAREKLRKGIACWIREGSVAKDLDELLPILDSLSSTTVGFCTDDRNPLDIAEEGHIDYLVRRAIAKGVQPAIALRAASFSVARHYGLDRGLVRIGALAPGYQADMILLEDLNSLTIKSVFKKGRTASYCKSQARPATTNKDINSIRCDEIAAIDLSGPQGNVHVIEVVHGKIITGRSVRKSASPGVAHLSVVERYGKGSKPANAYVAGFGENMKGAIASSVGHDSHNLIAVGSNPGDMALAFNALRKLGGGFAVTENGKVLASLALPFGGLMSHESPDYLKKQIHNLKQASRQIGCVLPEPFLQLAFLSLPVIPSLKLTDKGLVDVDRFTLIPVRV